MAICTMDLIGDPPQSFLGWCLTWFCWLFFHVGHACRMHAFKMFLWETVAIIKKGHLRLVIKTNFFPAKNRISHFFFFYYFPLPSRWFHSLEPEVNWDVTISVRGDLLLCAPSQTWQLSHCWRPGLRLQHCQMADKPAELIWRLHFYSGTHKHPRGNLVT